MEALQRRKWVVAFVLLQLVARQENGVDAFVGAVRAAARAARRAGGAGGAGGADARAIFTTAFASTPTPTPTTSLRGASSTNLALGDMLPYDMFKDSGDGDEVPNSNASLDLLLAREDEGEGELLLTSSGGGDGSTGAAVVRVSLKKLQEQWLDYCIEHNRPNDAGSFDIGIASRLASREDAHVIIEDEVGGVQGENRQNRHSAADGADKGEENGTHGTVYLTEQQLQQLWSAQLTEPLGKPAAAFSVQEALLLLPDADDALLLGPGGVGSASDTETMLAWSNMSNMNTMAGHITDHMVDTQHVTADDAGDGGDVGDGGDGGVDSTLASGAREAVRDSGGDKGEDETLFITATELQRVWDLRQEGKWGMPAPAFDERLALLLLDEDDDDGVMTASPAAVGTECDGDAVEHASAGFQYVAAADIFKGREPDDGYWERRYPGNGNGQQWLRDNLKQIYRDMEDMTPRRPAWKKDRHILTPDIDTQKFEGDIMNSNTYMTKRIPANWDDPERSEMSDIYLSTGSMSWEGEELTDFNAKTDVWQTLDLPLHRMQSSSGGRLMGAAHNVTVVSAAATAAAAAAAAAAADAAGTGAAAAVDAEVDWATFDFASMEGDGSASSASSATSATTATTAGGASEDPGAINIESFFRDVEDEGQDGAAAAGSVDLGRDTDFERDAVELVAGKSYESLKPKVVKWATPAEWAANPEFGNHVGHDEWVKYGTAGDTSDFIEHDDAWTEDDVLTAMAMRHVVRVTDTFLEDHIAAATRAEHRHYWERELSVAVTGNESLRKMRVPGYLKPDSEQGVDYSDELIEMKGKKSLHVKMRPPAELWAEDTFHHNEDLSALNQVGTVREQYEWQPLSDASTWAIDAGVRSRIAPLEALVNHAAVLRSTKDNVLTFEYKGRMRHIVGIRDMMLRAAKDCFPEIVDLRLETQRTSDKFDV